MKHKGEPQIFHPIEFDSSIFRASSLSETCQCIYDSGCRKTILETWAKSMDSSADKDDGRGRKKLANLGRHVAMTLRQEIPTIRDRSFENLSGITRVGDSIAQLRYDVMLRVAYHLRLSHDLRMLILRMFHMSAVHMKHELAKYPSKDHLQKYLQKTL